MHRICRQQGPIAELAIRVAPEGHDAAISFPHKRVSVTTRYLRVVAAKRGDLDGSISIG
eukprot:COSAG02_NODE_42633_length_382_cov_15.749117_1_plen_58_part_01